MSILLHVKGLVLTYMSDETPGLRQAIVDVINSIDSDIDQLDQQFGKIEWSEDTQTAIANLDLVLTGTVEETEAPSKIAENENEDETSSDPLAGIGEDDDDDATGS